MALLTAPDVRRVTWLAKTTTGWQTRTAATSEGFISADTGQVMAPVQITRLVTDRGNVLATPMAVGLPGHPSEPQLAAAPALTVPPSFRAPLGTAGQGDTDSRDTTFSPGHKQWAVFGVCYGQQPLVIQVNGHRIGVVACDSQTHELSVPASLLRGHTLEFFVHTSNLTAWRADIGTLR